MAMVREYRLRGALSGFRGPASTPMLTRPPAPMPHSATYPNHDSSAHVQPREPHESLVFLKPVARAFHDTERSSRGSIYFVLFIKPAPAPAHPKELAAWRGSTILLAAAELSGLSSLRLASGEACCKASEQTNGECGESVEPGSHAIAFLLHQAIPFNVGCHPTQLSDVSFASRCGTA